MNDKFQEMKDDARNRDNLSSEEEGLVGVLVTTESLTREIDWTNVFGRLNGVYPRAAFHKTVRATY